MLGGAPVLWILLVVVTVAVVIMILPIYLGAVVTYDLGHSSLRVNLSYAGIIRWQTCMPLQRLDLGQDGLQVNAEVKAVGIQRSEKEKLTLDKLSEEQRWLESRLHIFLSIIDIIQVYLLGKSPSDNQGRSLGSPTLHLLIWPFLVFGKQLYRLEFTWHTKLGLSDPALTAVTVGLLWSLKAGTVSLLRQQFQMMHASVVSVVPNYATKGFSTNLRCIFHFSLGQIMWRTLCYAAERWLGKGAVSSGG